MLKITCDYKKLIASEEASFIGKIWTDLEFSAKETNSVSFWNISSGPLK